MNDQFHSQFVLNPTEYRDNNNYIQFNKVTTFDDKWSLGTEKKEFGFLNFKQGPFWTSKAYHKDETVSLDGGQTEV